MTKLPPASAPRMQPYLTRWTGRLRDIEEIPLPKGYTLFPAAEKVLREFAGLHIGRCDWGLECGTCDFEMDPVDTTYGKENTRLDEGGKRGKRQVVYGSLQPGKYPQEESGGTQPGAQREGQVLHDQVPAGELGPAESGGTGDVRRRRWKRAKQRKRPWPSRRRGKRGRLPPRLSCNGTAGICRGGKQWRL